MLTREHIQSVHTEFNGIYARNSCDKNLLCVLFFLSAIVHIKRVKIAADVRGEKPERNWKKNLEEK